MEALSTFPGSRLEKAWRTTENELERYHRQKGKCHVYVDNYKNKDGEDRQSNKIKKLYAYDENVTTVQPAQMQTPQYSQPAQTGGWKAGAF